MAAIRWQSCIAAGPPLGCQAPQRDDSFASLRVRPAAGVVGVALMRRSEGKQTPGWLLGSCRVHLAGAHLGRLQHCKYSCA